MKGNETLDFRSLLLADYDSDQVFGGILSVQEFLALVQRVCLN
jgi:hypothetical protein